MPNEVLIKSGTAVTWQASGGTNVLTFTSLANNAGRIGAGYDRGATRSRRLRIQMRLRYSTAPTDNTTFDIYFATSTDNTNYDGGLTASDGALSSTDTLRNLVYVGSVVLDNVTTAQQQTFEIELLSRYIAPVVLNNATGQALSNTAGDHVLTITPIIDEIQ